MERSRELRRSSMMTTNGILRRKHKNDEDRGRKREREREREMSKSKRTREERFRMRDEEEEEDEDDDDEEEEEESVAAAAVAAVTDGSSSSSSLQHHHHHQKKRMLPPPPSNTNSSSYNHHHSKSFSRPSTVLKAAADEMIGVPVPRKARSVSVKRPHENRTSSASGGGGVVVGGGDEKMNQSSRRGGEVVDSPSSSNFSIRKKLKIKTSVNHASNSGNPSSAVQEDIEFEIAEVLFGMKKQSSMKLDVSADSSLKLETKSSSVAAGKSGSSNSSAVENPSDIKLHTSVLALNACTKSDPSRGDEWKRKSVSSENTGSKAVAGTKDEIEQSGQMQSSSSKLENDVSKPDLDSGEASADKLAAKVTNGSLDLKQNVEGEIMKPQPEEELGAQDKIDSEARLATLEEESTFQLHDCALRKEISKVSAVESKGSEKKFEIDLNHMMATPAPSSPERDSINALESDSIPIKEEAKMNSDNLMKDEKMKIGIKKEAGAKDSDDKTKVTVDKSKKSNLDIEKFDQQTRAALPKGKKKTESTTLPLPLTVAGWPNGIPPMGYLPPFPTALPVDGKTGSSTAFKPPEFLLCQPRPKRCATHQYIARNIDLHQKFVKMTQCWPAAAGSAALCGIKPTNGNAMSSAGNMVFGTPLQGSGPGLSLNFSQEKGHAETKVEKDKSCEAHSALRKQLPLQQAQLPAPANNILHGPPFIFPPANNQQSVPATTNQTAPSKSATSSKNTSSSTKGPSRPPTGSSAIPVSAGTVSFSLPNVAGIEAPFLAILQNNGYPFPISTPDGTPPALRGTSGQPLPFYNGSFYSPHLFHPSQIQQQPHSQPTAFPAPPNTSMQTSSSSSNKQPQDQVQKMAQISGSSSTTSKNLHFHQQQPQKHNGPLTSHSQKFEADVNGENVSSFAASRPPQVQKNIYGQNITVPMQPVNFTLMPSTMAGNRSEKHQAVEFIPSQTFTMPFASFGGNAVSSNLNFSSMAQNPTLVKSMQGIPQNGYQVAPSPQALHHKSFQISQKKNGSESNSADSGKKATLGKTATSTGQTLVFDNSSKTLTFMSSPVTCNQPSRSSTLSAIATASTVSSTSQQKQLLELQKQHSVQQQPSSATRIKSSTASSLPSSSITAKFPNSSPHYMPLIQCNSGAMSSQYKNPANTSTSKVSSLAASATSTLKNLPQKGRASQVTHISFGQQITANFQPPQPFLGNQHACSYQPPQPSVENQAASGNTRTGSKGSKVVSSPPTTQSQQTDNLSTNSQKSSPVCGRNVPSVLSNGPSHISEVKFQNTAN